MTRRKLTIAAVVLLVCGVVVALVVRRPTPRGGLVSTLTGLETNYRIVTATILVSNASPHAYAVTILGGGRMALVDPGKRGIFRVDLPTPRPGSVQIISIPAGTGKLSDQVRRLFWKPKVYTLNIPE